MNNNNGNDKTNDQSLVLLLWNYYHSKCYITVIISSDANKEEM